VIFHLKAVSQELEIKVGENIKVSKDTNGMLFMEPYLAIDPSDPNHLIAVSFTSPTSDESDKDGNCVVFSSSNAGQTWSRHDLTGSNCGDPWISITSTGLAFVTALGEHSDLKDPERQLLVYTSADKGETWSEIPQSIGLNHDGTRSLAAPDGTLYILSGQYLKVKENGRFGIYLGMAKPGEEKVETLPTIIPSNLNQNSDGLALLSDGSLVITYYDFQRKAEGGFRSRAGRLKTTRSWAMISGDGGQSFSEPLFITEDCWARPTFLSVDASGGPFNDRLYYVCEGDNQKEILLTYSDDRGEEWTIRSIESSAGPNGFRTEPQIAVNNQGIIGIIWMDRRDDPSADSYNLYQTPKGHCYALYFSASADGGESFSKPVRVSSDLSCPDYEHLGYSAVRWRTGGDYFGLVASQSGAFHLLWPDARSGSFELWTAKVSVTLKK